MQKNDFTTDTALVIRDADMTLQADVTTWADGQIFVTVADSDHDARITITLADWKRMVAAVDRKIA